MKLSVYLFLVQVVDMRRHKTSNISDSQHPWGNQWDGHSDMRSRVGVPEVGDVRSTKVTLIGWVSFFIFLGLFSIAGNTQLGFNSKTRPYMFQRK